LGPTLPKPCYFPITCGVPLANQYDGIEQLAYKIDCANDQAPLATNVTSGLSFVNLHDLQ
jgi:hypothetical protein